jgi:hypothetical protein
VDDRAALQKNRELSLLRGIDHPTWKDGRSCRYIGLKAISLGLRVIVHDELSEPLHLGGRSDDGNGMMFMLQNKVA